MKALRRRARFHDTTEAAPSVRRRRGRSLAAALLPAVIAGALLASDGFGRPWAGTAAPTCNGLTATIVGTEAAETITGTAGNDVIAALGGADTIDGAGGADVICPGPDKDNDSVNGNTGVDTLVLAGASKAVNVDLGTGKATGEGTDTVTGVENVVGSPLADKLVGDGNANNLSAGGGADTVDGGAGNDALDGGSGADTISFASSAGAVNASLAAGTATGAGTDSLAGFENMLGSASGDTLTGDGNANVVDGGKGNDALDGGGGNDTVSFVSSTVGVTASLEAGTATGAGSDSLASFENIVGTAKNDTLTGSAAANDVDAGKGTDTCRPGTGADKAAGCEKGEGAIEAIGVVDTYTFTAKAGEGVFVDSQSDSAGCSNLEWKLGGPSGDVFPAASHCNDRGPLTLSKKGTYTLTLSSAPGTSGTGDYEFKWWPVPAPKTFAYTVGTTVSNGAPSAGAGNIETPGVEDDYTFAGSAGQKLFYDELGAEGCDFKRTLVAPNGNVVPGADGLVCQNLGPITLPATGTYKLRIYPMQDDDIVGTYSFRIVDVPAPQSFAYTLGGTVDDGVPAAGAGNIESPQAEDKYTFSGTAGEKIFYDSLSVTGDNCNLERRLLSPNGTDVMGGFNCQDTGPVSLPTTGTYTLRIYPSVDRDDFGTYSFRITIESGVQTFPYTIGNTVSNGVPAPGAGNIESVGAEDHYTFTGSAGQKVFYDSLSATGDNCNFERELLSPSSAKVIGGYVCQDTGAITLPETGTYRLRVFPSKDQTDTGTYSFKITNVPAPQSFAYTIGTTVSNSVPGPGAGNIESPQAEDKYTFSGTAGQKLFYDSLSVTGDSCNFERHLLSPNGSEVLGGFNCQDTGAVTLPQTGTYTLRIVPTVNRADVGTYSFRITNVSVPQSFAYTLGGTVDDGVPAAGAGNIESPQAEDKYTFSGTAGQNLFYDSLSVTGDSCNFERHLLSPNGSEVLGGFNCQDTGAVTLPQTGTYTLRIVPTVNRADVGTYSFRITDVPAPQSFAYTIGTTVSNGVPGPGAGNIESPQAQDKYTFSGTAGQIISYDGIGGGNLSCQFQRTLMSPSDTVVPGTDGWVCQDLASITLPATGTYTLRIYPAANQADTGLYSFKVSSP